jgi:TusA-related sulfurtransferase
MKTVAQVMQETIEKAIPVMGKIAYRGVVSKSSRDMVKALSNQLIEQKKMPTVKYKKSYGQEICKRMESGETLKAIADDMNVNIATIYQWIEDDSNLLIAYNRAKSLMARTLVDKLIVETESLSNENALAARVRSDVVKWVASKFNPAEFSDLKRIELKGEVNHKHTHELAIEQKRRIAESWLISQEQDSALPAITAETTGPDLPALEGVAVHEICEGEQGERPKRKRSAQPAKTGKATGKRKPGRPRKLTVDDPIDRDDKPKAK